MALPLAQFTTMRVKVVGMAENNEATVTPITPSTKTPLQALQARFALSFIGGEMRILEWETIRRVQSGDPAATLHFFKRADALVLMRRFIESQPVPCPKPRDVIEDFFHDPEGTHEFKSLTFSPQIKPDEVLNLWVDYTITPQEGDWHVIEYYLYEVICDSDITLFRYICKYIAHALQKPEDKPGVMIVLVGDEGVGKGFFFQLLACIWGKSTLLVQDINTVVGTFNKALETSYMVCMDEALFVGDKRAQDKLKSLVTESTIQVEQKYEPSRTVDSYHRFFATTNRDQFAQIRTDDRRCLFIRVPNIKKQDTEYFGELHKALQDGKAVAAFVYTLLNHDISDFDPRARPKTTETYKQKVQSLSGFSRYWFEVLSEQRFTCGRKDYTILDQEWEKEPFISSRSLIEHYRNYDKSAERYESIQSSKIYAELGKLCPAAKEKRHDNKRGVQLPLIEIAREEFQEFIGDEVDWPE